MAIYIILYILALTGYMFGANKSTTNKKIYLFFMFSMILLVASLRDITVGTDLKQYYSRYYPQFANASWESLQSVTISGDWEWGFCAFCKILCSLSTDVRLFIAVTSIVSIVPYGLFIEKNSKDVVFSTALYLGYHMFSMNLSGIRQAMAVGIVLCGVDFLRQRKNLKFCIIVFLAMLIHTSAAVCFVLVLCNWMKFKKNAMYWLAAIILGLPLIYRIVFEKILSLSFFSSIYGLYSNNAHANGYITIHTVGMFVIMLLIFIVGFLGYTDGREKESLEDTVVTRSRSVRIGRIVLWRSKSVSEELSYSFLMYATYIAVLFRMSAFIVNVTARLSLYFIPFAMILYPETIERMIEFSENKSIIKATMWCALTAFALYITIFRAESLWGVVPYSLFN